MCEYMILEDFNMDKYIYDNSNGLWYELQGDYYIPCLVLPDEKEERHIGIWGHRHLRYIREHKKVLYTDLLISGLLLPIFLVGRYTPFLSKTFSCCCGSAIWRLIWTV